MVVSSVMVSPPVTVFAIVIAPPVVGVMLIPVPAVKLIFDQYCPVWL